MPDNNFAIEDPASAVHIRFRSEGLILWLAIVICGLLPVGLATALFDLHKFAH